MAGFKEYDQFDGLGLAKLVKEGKVSAADLGEESIRRAEAINPKLNAIILPLYDSARKTAGMKITGTPFTGVPFLLKDVHHALKGVAMSSGCSILKDYVPGYDAEIVIRFKNTGVNIIGKTNTPEFKLAYVTEPLAFGPTRNPWNTDYSSGGSSGGSAAAVAARIVPLASATDEGGSIRVPSSYCGLFGLKPSRGRNPVGPDFSQEWDGMSASHVLTRSVRDSAAMLDAVSGPEPGSPYSIMRPERPFLDETGLQPGNLRIAFHTRNAYGRSVHPECVQAVQHAAKLLESLGHHVEEAEPDYIEEEAALNYFIVMMGHTAVRVEDIIKNKGRSATRRHVELSNFTLHTIGKSYSADEFVRSKNRWRELGLTMARFFQKYDMLLTPTIGEPPVLVGSQVPGKKDVSSMKLLCSWAGKLILANRKLTGSIMSELIVNTMKGQMPFTLIANVTGVPAMSVPICWTGNGMPCGVQFIGRYGEEASLFRLAAQLEKAQPWFDKVPPAAIKL